MNDSLFELFQSFPYALAAGLLVGVTCSMLGVFVILKRVVFIGIALSELAACGIAGALVVGLPRLAGATIVTLGAVVSLAAAMENRRMPRDALLGVLFVAASSLSVLLVSRSGLGLHEVKALLYGDLILTSRDDLAILFAILLPTLACLLVFLRPLSYTFLDREAAFVLRVHPARWELIFFLLLGLVIAAASKVAGALLVFCYLVVPASAALLLSRWLGQVLLLAGFVAAMVTLAGFGISFAADLPTNQTICVSACALLLLVLPLRLWKRN